MGCKSERWGLLRFNNLYRPDHRNWATVFPNNASEHFFPLCVCNESPFLFCGKRGINLSAR